MKESERFMRRVLDVARQYHDHIREANRGGWSDLAQLLSHPQSKISSQTIWNWVNRKLPERIEFFLAERIGCTVSELRGDGGEATKIDEESMTPDERIIVAHYRRADPKEQDALFRVITGQNRPPPQPEPAGLNVVAFKKKRR